MCRLTIFIIVLFLSVNTLMAEGLSVASNEQKAFSTMDSLPAPESFFSAIIVSDIDAAIDWYTQILGLEVLDKKEYEEMGFKQANLRGDVMQLELIELRSAVMAKDVIPDYTPKTRMVGLFKIGFIVPDFDAWLQHLKALEVNFHGDVVKDPVSGKRMVIIKDLDGNRIQFFEK